MSSAAIEVLGLAREAQLTIAVAESLTGGLLIGELIGPGGASAVVRGGIVAYDTALKHSLLGVDAQLLASHGPVDPEVAALMALGVREATVTASGRADIGVSTTGVAGPDPDPQTGAAVGTVFIGISSRLGERTRELRLEGNRDQIRGASVTAAIAEVLAELNTLNSTRS